MRLIRQCDVRHNVGDLGYVGGALLSFVGILLLSVLVIHPRLLPGA